MSIETAFHGIERALETGNVGTPVAMHAIVQSDRDADELANELLQAAERWLQDSPASMDTFAATGAGHQCRLVRFRSGKMALLATGRCAPADEFLKILVVGNHGIVSWEDDSGLKIAEHVAGAESNAESARKSIRPGIEPPYGVLLVSGDHTHQPNYALALAADSRCRIVGLTDSPDVDTRRRELNERLAKRLDVPLLPDFDKALARDDVQIVSICAEPFRRGPMIAKAARAGKHLYLDKPLAGSIDHVREIVAAVGHSGVVANMFSFAQVEAFRRMRRIVASGRLGDLVSVHCDLFFAKGFAGTAELGRPRQESAAPTRYELPDAKRELTNVGVYCLVDLLTALEQRVSRVSAATGNFFFIEHQQNDMEDFGQMLLETTDGVVCSVSAGRTGWQSWPSFGLNRMWMIGTRGAMTIDADRPRAEVWSDAPVWLPPPRNPEDPMGMWMTIGDDPHRPAPKHPWITESPAAADADVKHFLDALQFGYAGDVAVETAAHTSEILFAAYASAATGEAVRV